MKKLTGRNSVPIVPWPQSDDFSHSTVNAEAVGTKRCHPAMLPSELDNYLVRAAAPGFKDAEKQREEQEFRRGNDCRFNPGRSPCFAELLRGEGDTFLAIQTDAPRKALPLLLTGWLLFKQRHEGKSAKLIIKLSSLDFNADLFRMHFHASLALRRAAQRIGVSSPGVWFIYDRLSTGEHDELLSSCDALVSATMGEGFGGPLAEALIRDVPIIAPFHTSCRDILGDDYPLAVDADPHVLALWHNIPVYSPSSVWHVVDDESLVDCFCRFARMPKPERHRLARAAKQRLLERAGPAAVRSVVAAELETSFLQTRSAPSAQKKSVL